MQDTRLNKNYSQFSKLWQTKQLHILQWGATNSQVGVQSSQANPWGILGLWRITGEGNAAARVTPSLYHRWGVEVLPSFTLSLCKDKRSRIPPQHAELPWAGWSGTSWGCASQCDKPCECTAHCPPGHPRRACSPGSPLRCLPHMSPLCSFSERKIHHKNITKMFIFQGIVHRPGSQSTWTLGMVSRTPFDPSTKPNLEFINAKFRDSSGQPKHLIYLGPWKYFHSVWMEM